MFTKLNLYVVVSIVTCFTNILVVHADTCPIVATGVHALVYLKPPSTKLGLHALPSYYSYESSNSKPTYERRRGRERDKRRHGKNLCVLFLYTLLFTRQWFWASGVTARYGSCLFYEHRSTFIRWIALHNYFYPEEEIIQRENVLWRIWPLLGNGSVNTVPELRFQEYKDNRC
jgi:hypothetical protein